MGYEAKHHVDYVVVVTNMWMKSARIYANLLPFLCVSENDGMAVGSRLSVAGGEDICSTGNIAAYNHARGCPSKVLFVLDCTRLSERRERGNVDRTH